MTIRKPKGWGSIKPPVGFGIDWSDPINKGLIGCWLFNEGAGGTLFDIAQKNHGTINGTASWVPGKYGPGVSFNGTTNYVGVPYAAALAPANASVSFWLKESSAPSNLDTPFARKYDGTGIPILCDFRGGGFQNLTFGTFNSGNHFVTANTALTVGPWYHIVGTFDGTTKKIYINGVLDNSLGDSTAFYGGSSLRLTIGCLDLNGTPSRFFKGTVDNVRYIGRALTAGEVSRLYSDPFAGVLRPRRRLWNGAPAAAGGATRPVKMAGEWGGYASAGGGFAG